MVGRSSAFWMYRGGNLLVGTYLLIGVDAEDDMPATKPAILGRQDRRRRLLSMRILQTAHRGLETETETEPIFANPNPS